MVRNISDIRVKRELVMTDGKFRVVRFSPPYFDGSEYWVVNEKGFMWEPADSFSAALAYLQSAEAQDYQRETELAGSAL
jgi:hypothetical protein